MLLSTRLVNLLLKNSKCCLGFGPRSIIANLACNWCRVLASLKKWLEPLPDGSLPNTQVWNMMLQILVALPINLEEDMVMQKIRQVG